MNTITPALVQQYGFPVLPLEDLVDYLLNLRGLGGKHTSPLGFVILHMQVWGIAGYDEDAVFLVVPNEFKFGWRVPLVVGTCTIGRIINIIRESEIDSLSMLWSTMRVVQLFPASWAWLSLPLRGQRLQLEVPVRDPHKGTLMSWLRCRRVPTWGHSRLR